MRVIILTTKRYYSFVKKNEVLNFGELVEFGNSLKTYINNPSGEVYNNGSEDIGTAQLRFYATKLDLFDDQEISFWEKDVPIVKILKFKLNEDLIYMLPCIPEFQIESREGLMLNQEERQNYIGSFIKDVCTNLDSCGYDNREIYILAHDKDLYDESVERIMISSDVTEQSILGLIIASNVVLLDNIYGYQHSTKSDINPIYSHILKLLATNNNYEHFFDNIIKEIQISKLIMG